jgi:hypothetical protein
LTSATTRLMALFFLGAEARFAETFLEELLFEADGRLAGEDFFADDPPAFFAEEAPPFLAEAFFEEAPPFLAEDFFAEDAFLAGLEAFLEEAPPFFDDTFLEDLLDDDTPPFFEEAFDGAFLEEEAFFDEAPPFFDDTFFELADFFEADDAFFDDADFFEALPFDELPFFAAILFSFCQNSFGGEPYFFERK